MITNEDHSELIEQYLQGELPEPRRSEFQRRMAEDANFRREVRLQQKLVQSIQRSGIASVKEELKRIHREVERELEEHTPPNATDNSSRADKFSLVDSKKSRPGGQWSDRWVWLMAASVAVVLVCTLPLLRKLRQPDYAAIAGQYFNAYPNIAYVAKRDVQPVPSKLGATPELRGNQALPANGHRSATTSDSLARLAFAAYDQQHYGTSIRLFRTILRQQKNELVSFYLGVAYLGNQQPQASIASLENYLEHYRELAPEARWYLSLAYLQLRQAEKARPLLQELSRSDNDYQSQAIEVLGKL